MKKIGSKSHREIFIFFSKLGLLGFGGPLALISSMQDELIEKRQWISRDEFNQAFSLIKAMPGPVAFMAAVYLGKKRGHLFGGLLAGLGLVWAPFLMMIFFSIYYVALKKMAFSGPLFLGMQVVALGVILGSLKGLVKKNAGDIYFWLLVIMAFYLNLKFTQYEPLFILFAGLWVVLIKKMKNLLIHFELSTVFLICLKAGALVFGSGLAIVPMLRHDFVDRYHYLTATEFLDALVLGQMTPGPVVITSTFIGHHLYGFSGAFVCTCGIFMASFFHMMTWFPLAIEKLKNQKWIDDFTYGAFAFVVGPIIAAVVKMMTEIHLSFLTIVFFIMSFLVTLTGKIPLWALIPLGGGFFYILSLFGPTMH